MILTKVQYSNFAVDKHFFMFFQLMYIIFLIKGGVVLLSFSFVESNFSKLHSGYYGGI